VVFALRKWWEGDRERTIRRAWAFPIRARSDHDQHTGGVNGSPGERKKNIQRMLVRKVSKSDYYNSELFALLDKHVVGFHQRNETHDHFHFYLLERSL
jgi:hypothetical protein